ADLLDGRDERALRLLDAVDAHGDVRVVDEELAGHVARVARLARALGGLPPRVLREAGRTDLAAPEDGLLAVGARVVAHGDVVVEISGRRGLGHRRRPRLGAVRG